MAGSTLLTINPATVDSLLTTTREAVLKSKEFLNDAIFNKIALLSWLEKKNKVTLQGGASILVPLMFAKNSTFNAYSGDDIISTVGQEGLTMAQATWRSYAGTIKYAGDEIRMNGAEKLYDLAKAKIMQGTMSARDKLAADLFASSQAAKAIHCMPILVDQSSSVQGINSTTYSWWQAQLNASVGSFATNGLDKMRDTRDDIAAAGQDGGPGVDFIVTTQLVKELYEASQLPAYRYGPSDKPDASHQALLFAGAVMDFDSNVATGEMYLLPSDALEFVCHADAQWDLSDFESPPTQDVYIAKMIWMGNLVTNNRRRLGKLTGITA